MARLYRGMKGHEGRPVVGPTGRTLGVRPGADVPAVLPDDLVSPEQGGMSVAPDDPHALPEHRRPVEFGGFGKDPVWGIEENDLGPDLSYRPDPDREGHGFIEPARPMALKEYQEAIERTLPLWMPEVPAEGGTSDD